MKLSTVDHMHFANEATNAAAKTSYLVVGLTWYEHYMGALALFDTRAEAEAFESRCDAGEFKDQKINGDRCNWDFYDVREVKNFSEVN